MAGNIPEMIEFVAKHEWIYNFQLTNYISDRIWGRIPSTWSAALTQMDITQLNAAPYNFQHCEQPAGLPENLKIYLEKSHELGGIIDRKQIARQPLTLPPEIKRGMNPKKQHEVAYMATVVHDLCQNLGVREIVDVGAGLGYLGQVLCSQFKGYRVLGLESVSSRTHGADSMASKKAIQSEQLMSATFELRDDADSFQAFAQMAHENFGKYGSSTDQSNKALQAQKMCMIGLHCCADLTPTMIKLFCESPAINSMVCVGCCYHNMSANESGNFTNFPMSRAMKDACEDVKKRQNWRMCQYGLRLAAQETRARWSKQSEEDHSYHANNVAFRGLLEFYCQQTGLNLHKTKRRVARKQDYVNFTSYVNAVLERLDFSAGSGNLQDASTTSASVSTSHGTIPMQPSKDIIRRDLEELYTKHEAAIKSVEPLTCLQVSLQPVLEALTLEDRRQYLLERGYKVDLVPVFNDFVSPRNVAIVAWKE